MADVQQGGEVKKQMTLVTVLLLAIVLMLIGVIITIFVMNTKAPEVKKVVVKETPEIGPVKSLGDFILNLADAGEPRYVKLGISFEIKRQQTGAEGTGDDNAKAELKMRDAQLKDIVVVVVSSKTSQELSTPEGKEALKKELKQKLSAVLTTTEVVNIFFDNFAIQ